MTELTSELVLALLELWSEPVVVLDPSQEGLPAMFANRPFLERRGEGLEQLRGRALASLLGEETAALAGVRERLMRGESVALRPKPGSAFAAAGAQLEIRPLRGPDGAVHSCWCLFRGSAPAVAASAPVAPLAPAEPEASGLHPQAREDRLTGLCHRDFFNDLYPRDFAIAAREGRPLAFFAVDIDELGSYNDTFGRLAGDSVIRRVGRALSSALRRAGDLITREEGGRYAALAIGMDPEQALRHAETLAARVRELYIHHPHSKVARFVTVTVGLATVTPEPGQLAEILRGAAGTALARAREQGRNRVGLLTLPL